MLPEEDRPPVWLRDQQSIDVQVDNLQSFAKALLADLEKNFGTHVPQVYDVMAKQACVGDGLFFQEMDLARQRHYESLTATVNLLRGYTSGTYAIGKGAETVAKNYTNADDLAQVTVSDVHKAMPQGTPGPATHALESASSPITASDSGLTDKGIR
ncbi:hypothetical protein HC028_12940 [Planosporangium flavigriseum]|uniref:Uncharacterized protein n=1 Tax=Planosporangium flavigriseum TaxID=373681 RepID=A0A8J3PMS9_9ACTN|nr:hypothetical protein [Planosporangium flavigriseum]NJC65404.1 hypothetical protein [Planosporangium flavigriseum]GIG73241.1 hypothetical protein Pfl04_16450 [Planosporangium flavigriseum]